MYFVTCDGDLNCIYLSQGSVNQETYPTHTYEMKAKCTTDATNSQGVRHSCDFAQPPFTPPTGWVINVTGIKGEETEANGSEHCFACTYANCIQVGLAIVPQTFTMSVHARSPHGTSSGRGWEAATYSIPTIMIGNTTTYPRASCASILCPKSC